MRCDPQGDGVPGAGCAAVYGRVGAGALRRDDRRLHRRSQASAGRDATAADDHAARRDGDAHPSGGAGAPERRGARHALLPLPPDRLPGHGGARDQRAARRYGGAVHRAGADRGPKLRLSGPDARLRAGYARRVDQPQRRNGDRDAHARVSGRAVRRARRLGEPALLAQRGDAATHSMAFGRARGSLLGRVHTICSSSALPGAVCAVAFEPDGRVSNATRYVPRAAPAMHPPCRTHELNFHLGAGNTLQSGWVLSLGEI